MHRNSCRLKLINTLAGIYDNYLDSYSFLKSNKYIPLLEISPDRCIAFILATAVLQTGDEY